MNDLKTFLNNFLDTINYPDNKEEFINKLLSVMYLETVDELLTKLPQDKQDSIKQQLSSATTPEAIQTVVNNNFDKNSFEETLKNTSQKVFTDYLQTIDSALTKEQKTKLQQYFSTVAPKNLLTNL